MAKQKGKKGPPGGVNSHIRARLNYLHTVTVFLQSAGNLPKQTTVEPQSTQCHENIQDEQKDSSVSDSARIVPVMTDHGTIPEEKKPSDTKKTTEHLPQLSRVYISHMRGVSLKSQMRLPIEVKRSFCKRCDSLLVKDLNCVHEIRNASRGRKKPWADVLVIRCTTCGTEKRFPQTEKRSKKLPERRREQEQKEQEEQKEQKDEAMPAP